MADQSAYKYKNISGQKQVVINVGEVEPGEIVESEQPIENPNFERVLNSGNRVGIDPVTPTPKKK